MKNLVFLGSHIISKIQNSNQANAKPYLFIHTPETKTKWTETIDIKTKYLVVLKNRLLLYVKTGMRPDKKFTGHLGIGRAVKKIQESRRNNMRVFNMYCYVHM